MYEIELAPAALRFFKKTKDKKLLEKINVSIDGLKKDPLPHGHKKLVLDDADIYRIRVGDYRVLYKIYNRKLLITVIRIGPRKEIYRMI